MSKQKLIPLSVNIADPGATKRLLLAKVPSGGGAMSVAAARVICDTILANGDSNVRDYALQDGGTDGTGTTVICASLTNTVASAASWAVATPREFTVDATKAVLAEGHWLVLVYTKTGTDAPKNTTVNVDLAQGQR